MRLFFTAYQFIAPFLFLPATYYLWLRSTGDSTLALFIVTVPVAYGYLLPGFFTNVLKLWEFNTGFKIGAFRPHNGFVFGAFNSLVSWLALQPHSGPIGWGEILRAGFALGSVTAFWGWYYDLWAVKSKFISIYNRSAFEGKSPAEIVSEYAPMGFGGYGFAYGIAVRVAELLLHQQGRVELFWPLWAGMVAFCFVMPPLLYLPIHYWAHGHFGLKSYKAEIRAAQGRG
ncbi:MAG: hypothetical protein NDJ89_17165 [Oligoflexia bacterium]|nr:hypothetical protein [Oligoflexia bacterium]